MNATRSPYAGKPESQWGRITRRLLAAHPLKGDEILDVAQVAWRSLWSTTVGAGRTAVRLEELRVPATVTGYFFEVLFAGAMERRHPGRWRRGRGKDDKDLVYLPDPRFSVELKTSGQLGYKVYGNRSYGQRLQRESLAKKDKSGYYLTVNFWAQTLTLVRFGWIDAEDWRPQQSPTGQMAGLPESVYTHKLVPIGGAYQLEAPVGLLRGVGPKSAARLEALGVRTVGDLVTHRGALPPALVRLREAALARYGP